MVRIIPVDGWNCAWMVPGVETWRVVMEEEEDDDWLELLKEELDLPRSWVSIMASKVSGSVCGAVESLEWSSGNMDVDLVGLVGE